MLIKDKDIIIRNATVKDADILLKWWNDGDVMAHAGYPQGLKTTKEKVVAGIEEDNDLIKRRLIIEYEGNPIGEMYYENKGDRTALIGIKICDLSKQNKGLGREILKLFFNNLFTELMYNKIVLDTNYNNKRAQHVYDILGFTKTGIRIDSWTNQLGISQTSVDYELYKKDFVFQQ